MHHAPSTWGGGRCGELPGDSARRAPGGDTLPGMGEKPHASVTPSKVASRRRRVAANVLPPDPFGEPPREEAETSFEQFKFIPANITGSFGAS